MVGFLTVLFLAGKPTNDDHQVMLMALPTVRERPPIKSEAERSKAPYNPENDPDYGVTWIEQSYLSATRPDLASVIRELEETHGFTYRSRKDLPSTERIDRERQRVAILELKKAERAQRTYNPPEIRPVT